MIAHFRRWLGEEGYKHVRLFLVFLALAQERLEHDSEAEEDEEEDETVVEQHAQQRAQFFNHPIGDRPECSGREVVNQRQRCRCQRSGGESRRRTEEETKPVSHDEPPLGILAGNLLHGEESCLEGEPMQMDDQI